MTSPLLERVYPARLIQQERVELEDEAEAAEPSAEPAAPVPVPAPAPESLAWPSWTY
jgi:hypothetical protein